MFIHIKPEEARTIQRIPRALLFPAPGLPKGHLLLGYTSKGECPMLINGNCSIYEDRPLTCRDYDCRVFAATGIQIDSLTQPEIADRVKAWVFEYESEESREEQRLLKEAAAFLQANSDLFPPGSISTYPVQLAVLTVKIYRLFAGLSAGKQKDSPAMSDAMIAQEIVRALNPT
jgi:Fe-S-cluster containining protein